MARRYSSFLVRYWRLDSGKRRIEIEHIQSGDRTRTASLAAAVAWIEIHEGGSTGGLEQSVATDERQPGGAEQAYVEDA